MGCDGVIESNPDQRNPGPSMIDLSAITGFFIQNGSERSNVERVVSALGIHDTDGHLVAEYPAAVLIGLMLDRPDENLFQAIEETYSLTVSRAVCLERDTNTSSELHDFIGYQFGESLAGLVATLAQTPEPPFDILSIEVNQWPHATAGLILQFGRRYSVHLEFGPEDQVLEQIVSPIRRPTRCDREIIEGLGRLYRDALAVQSEASQSETADSAGIQSPFGKAGGSC